ncbi:hypothetical protein [Synechococcus elongatus]|uniref:hypothetical protein n=1 Tax=Synechococcus elongatus TaxID=32046 RepID=UPI000F7D7331|nr:hypothetical protein [Synechococcus elongatus]
MSRNNPRPPAPNTPTPIGNAVQSYVNWWGNNVRNAWDAYNQGRGELFYGLTGGLVDTRPRRPAPQQQNPPAQQPPRGATPPTPSAPPRQQLVSQSSVPVRMSSPRGTARTSQTQQNASNPAISGYIPDANYKPLWQLSNEELMAAAPRYASRSAPNPLFARDRQGGDMSYGEATAADYRVDAPTVDPSGVPAFEGSGNYFEDFGRVTGQQYQPAADSNRLQFSAPSREGEIEIDPMLRFRRNQLQKGIIASGADYYVTTGSDGRTTRRLTPEEVAAYKNGGRLPSDYVAAAYQGGGGGGGSGLSNIASAPRSRGTIDYSQASTPNPDYRFPQNTGPVPGVDYNAQIAYERNPNDMRLAFKGPQAAPSGPGNVLATTQTTPEAMNPGSETFNLSALFNKAEQQAGLRLASGNSGSGLVTLPDRGEVPRRLTLPDRGDSVEVTTLPYRFR